MKVRIAGLTAVFAVCLLFNLSLRVPDSAQVQAQVNSNCPTIDVPATTIGSGDDQYLLGDPTKFALLNSGGDGFLFATNNQNFGGNATLPRIISAGGSGKGLTLSTVRGKAVMLSCRDSFWDINFMLAGLGATAGDKVRLFMQPDATGNGAFDLARFEVPASNAGVNLTFLESSAKLDGNGHIQLTPGAFLPYALGAGQSGRRTDQITISLSMDKNAPTMKCLHLGIEILRDAGNGTTTLVLNSTVMTREGATASGPGLFTGRPGTFPTRSACDLACPICPVTCSRADIPVTTIGANDDQFLLAKPLQMLITNSSGEASFFATNDINFGGNATLTRIAAAGRSAQGLRVAGAGSNATAISCRDSFWDINFMLAGVGATAGDRVRLFLQPDDSGKGAIDLARFTVTPGGDGVNLNFLESTSKLYANNHIQQNVGAFLGFNINAGLAGKRTDQITISLSMDKNAPTMGCRLLGVEIIRGSGLGSTTIAFNSFVLVRDKSTTATGPGLFTGIIGSYPTKTDCDGLCPSCCPTAPVPATTVGLAGTIEDQFALKDPVKLTLLGSTGDASFFATNDQNFGGNATLPRIAAGGGQAQGLRISTINGRAVAVSCRDSFWDINFMLAGSGVTTGDRVRIYLEADDTGKGAIDLARFVIGAGGATLNYLEPTSKIYGNGHVQQNAGAFLPFAFNAGTSGKRTDQITISLSMDKNAPTMKCLHLVAEILRDGGAGTTAVVFNSIVLTHEGPSNGTGTGLFSGRAGTYATQAPCDGVCPVCDR